MRFVDEYRDAAATRGLAAALKRITTRPWTIMEVCGGQTHAIVRFGLDSLLPPGVTLVHGPGCPVCVTAAPAIDAAVALAGRQERFLLGEDLHHPVPVQDVGERQIATGSRKTSTMR